MKTTNQNTRSSYFYTILYSGIMSTFFIANSFANSSSISQHSFESENNLVFNAKSLLIDTTKIIKPEMAIDSEKDIENSVSSVAAINIKPIIETIFENEQIIESKEDFNLPIYSGTTIEDIILENEMIIESNRIDDTFPLNFNLINAYSIENKLGVITKKTSILEKL